MRDWYVGWRSAEIYGTQAALHVHDVPWWAYGTERLVECIDTYLCRHRWCTPPEWSFHIPTYSLKADEDGYLDHSIGGALFTSFQWGACLAHRRQTNRLDVDLTDEWLAANGQMDPWPDDEEDEDV